jgi:2-oxoglutarate ferredoxin oxidoreductase subunit alpha
MYSERGPDYIYNMERLLRKFNTAANLVPQPDLRNATQKTPFGVIYFGSTSPAMREALDVLEAEGIHVDAMRLQAFPVPGIGVTGLLRTTTRCLWLSKIATVRCAPC